MDILEKERKLKKLEDELDRLEDEQEKREIIASIEAYKVKTMSKLTAWDRVLLARHSERPNVKTYIDALFEDFFELHGDRQYADDASVIGGIALFGNRPLTVIGHRKGCTTAENIACNFGMAHPEGYRKARRLMKQAEKFDRPIVTFIDTPGAYPGIGAEARGQATSIADNLFEMSDLGVPIITFIVGEGGSGGALAVGMGNTVVMLENSIYSILSPEGYASILWKDASKMKEAAEVMKLTSYDLAEHGIIDGIVKEPLGGAHHDPEMVFDGVRETLSSALTRFAEMTPYEIKTARYAKYRQIGFFQRFNYDHLKPGGQS